MVAFDPMGLLLGVLCATGGILLWRLNRGRNQFSLTDLLLDHRTKKASLSKMMQMGCFVISTWGFVYLTLAYKLSEWYFTSYMLAWSGTQLADLWIKTKGQSKEKHNAGNL